MQVAREAHFKGQSYLDLTVDSLPDLTDKFYAGVGFRTDQSNVLLLHHRAQVLIRTDRPLKPSVMTQIERYVAKVPAMYVCVCVFSTEWGVSGTTGRRPCGSEGWQ